MHLTRPFYSFYSDVLRQCEEWIRFSYSNEDTKDEERRKGWVSDTTKCGAKRGLRWVECTYIDIHFFSGRQKTSSSISHVFGPDSNRRASLRLPKHPNV